MAWWKCNSTSILLHSGNQYLQRLSGIRTQKLAHDRSCSSLAVMLSQFSEWIVEKRYGGYHPIQKTIREAGIPKNKLKGS